jgi:hypothetical protein
MPITIIRARALSIATMLALGGATFDSANASSQPQDTTGAIQTFDILGVKLGMSEAQAVAAVQKRYPGVAGADLKLGSPAVRAGVRFDLKPNPRGTNYDFVKIYLNGGRVWAVWRDDLSASYPYEKTITDLGAKFPGASPIMEPYDVVAGNARQPGSGRIIKGYELYKGNCVGDYPIRRVNSSDFIRLDGGCSMFFVAHYGVLESGGVKALTNGTLLIVDVDVGRSFLANLNRGAALPTSPAKL